ncbi:hypothetical protein GCM10023153_24650 [Ornithinibacter aureus]|uniref:Helix-turn-helix domain-containing protein n=1 Tax=Ornithinibacter aureus TaxID=622664 RepID=A0ABP8K0V6_9MICO|nr:helix-turn-helix domain-containing protein [Ornithinibacter aureus]KAF0833075.1 helix-turn-helix protein [Ornithinibacter aureus]
MTDSLLTTEEVAAMVHLSPATIRWHRHRGTGPRGFSPPGMRRVLYRASEVERWIAAGEPAATSA